MATVYLAADLKHGRKVAIKMLKPELAAVLGEIASSREIRTTAGLQHPHILPLFDSGDASGFLFFAQVRAAPRHRGPRKGAGKAAGGSLRECGALPSTPRRLTNTGDSRGPVWSPDCRRIAFSSERDGTDDTDLFVRNVPDDQPPRPILSLPGPQSMTDWPEDDLLVIGSGSTSGIFLVDLSGDSATVRPYHAPTERDVDDLRNSPDGEIAADVSDESGQDEVCIRSFPEPRAETVVSEGGGHLPQWSPAGDTLYRCDQTSLCAAEIATEPTAGEVALGGDGVARGHRLHGPPPGRRPVHHGTAFECRRHRHCAAHEPERHVVVHNWFGELRRICETGGR